MPTYISILRGINVSGQKKILMADLKVLYEGLKFKEVITYIQSGNIIFKTEKPFPNKEIANKIEKTISAKYKFDVPVIVRSVEEIKNIISINPFVNNKGVDIEKLHVTFLNDIPAKENLTSIKSFNFPPDEFNIIGKEVFLHCPVSYGETKLSNKFFESKLKVTATTRNWKTVNKLMELAVLDRD